MSEKDVILKVENVSKLYRLGTVGSGTFGGDVQRFWKTKILGQEDPFLKIGQTNDRTSKEKADFVWALQDINFEVKRGEVLGIIGKNGAGKSTLLKLLSRITSPTTGSIKSAGRMASLLEVGTGFHPELTGRENIYLNGAILGMTKKEIQSKFDEIVDFSGCELYIDTPTKRYSSGMTVRLGFAVAAFLDPEILVVDEVLAVGDAEFQKKAIGKMKEVSQGGGRTVLFVSHNMGSIKALCNTGILMENGKVTHSGRIDNVVKQYLGGNNNELNYRKLDFNFDNFILNEISIFNNNKTIYDPITRDNEIIVKLKYFNPEIDNIYFNLKIKDDEGNYILVTCSDSEKDKLYFGNGLAQMKIPSSYLNEGTYYLDLMIIQKTDSIYNFYFDQKDILTINVLPENRDFGSYWIGKEVGYITPKFEWHNDPSN